MNIYDIQELQKYINNLRQSVIERFHKQLGLERTDKYNELNTIIKKGTIIAQVIPFKRDAWKMSIEPLKKNEYKQNIVNLFSQFINSYKDKFWSRKTWL